MRIPDLKRLYEETQSNDDGLLRLPIDDTVDLKKCGLKPYPAVDGASLLNKDIDKPCLVTRLVDLTSRKSIYSRNPNEDIIEDRKQKDVYSRSKDIKLVLDRTKMIIIYFEWFLQMD